DGARIRRAARSPAAAADGRPPARARWRDCVLEQLPALQARSGRTGRIRRRGHLACDVARGLRAQSEDPRLLSAAPAAPRVCGAMTICYKNDVHRRRPEAVRFLIVPLLVASLTF